MYARRPVDGLGVLPVWVIPLITAGGAATATIASALIMRPSSPKQEAIESQIKLQHELEIKRMLAQQQQTEQLMPYVLPAVGVVALVMLLR